MSSSFRTMGFRSALAALFPDQSTKRTARFLDKTQRAVQRWVQDEAAPDNIMGAMRGQVERLEDTGFIGELDAMVARARENGLHDEVIAAHLAHHYVALLGREID